jgi:hypothetical protein
LTRRDRLAAPVSDVQGREGQVSPVGSFLPSNPNQA